MFYDEAINNLKLDINNGIKQKDLSIKYNVSTRTTRTIRRILGLK